MPTPRFEAARFIPGSVYSRITDLRIKQPGLARKLLAERSRRRLITKDGKLALVAADHPARMVTGIREDPLRMGRRQELLSRVLRVIACSPFDGVLGTADVINDLAVLSSLSRKGGALIDGRLLIGSVNRGGIAGSSFELDDRVTGYDVKGAVQAGLDGVKFLLRFDPNDSGSLDTLSYCVGVLRECAAAKMPLFVEPLPVVRRDGKVMTDNDKGKLVKLVGVVSGLGSSSANVWLKLPYCEGFGEVARATTLPILLLGGEASDDVRGLLAQIESAMKSAPNVRGVMMGRNLLYPPGGDPLPLAMAIDSIVHEGLKVDEVMNMMNGWAGRFLDVFP